MTELVRRDTGEIVDVHPQALIPVPAVAQTLTFDQMYRLAECIAKSGLYAMKTPEQAMVLMQVAQVKGLHPIQAVEQYHIINGRPAMRSDAMQAAFQREGGTVEWLENSDKRVVGRFTRGATSITITWDMEKAKHAGLLNKAGPWQQFPAAMMRARCISEGVRAVLPGVIAGIYTPEEVADFEPATAPPTRLEETRILPPEPVQRPQRAANGNGNGAHRRTAPEPAPVAEPAPAPAKRDLTKEEAQAAVSVAEASREKRRREIEARQRFAEHADQLGLRVKNDAGQFSLSEAIRRANAVLGKPESDKPMPELDEWLRADELLEDWVKARAAERAVAGQGAHPYSAAAENVEKSAAVDAMLSTLQDDEDPFAEDDVPTPSPNNAMAGGL